MPPPSDSVVLFSVSYIGDLVAATLTFDMIARRCAGPLRVVTAPAGAALLAADPRVATIGVVGSSQPLMWRAEVLRELWQARRQRARVVNLEVYEPRWRFVRAGAQALGLQADTLNLGHLLADNQRSADRQPTHVAHRSSYYAEAVGGSPPAPPQGLYVRENDSGALRQRLVELGVSGGNPLIVVHPGSNAAKRRPTPQLLAAALAHLGAELQATIMIVGVAAEAHLGAALTQALPDSLEVIDTCGRLDLRCLMALISRAALFVGGDSGPLKLAEALGTRTLSFWAPGAPAPEFAGPRGPGHAMWPVDCDPQAAAELALIDRSRTGG